MGIIDNLEVQANSAFLSMLALLQFVAMAAHQTVMHYLLYIREHALMTQSISQYPCAFIDDLTTEIFSKITELFLRTHHVIFIQCPTNYRNTYQTRVTLCSPLFLHIKMISTDYLSEQTYDRDRHFFKGNRICLSRGRDWCKGTHTDIWRTSYIQ